MYIVYGSVNYNIHYLYILFCNDNSLKVLFNETLFPTRSRLCFYILQYKHYCFTKTYIVCNRVRNAFFNCLYFVIILRNENKLLVQLCTCCYTGCPNITCRWCDHSVHRLKSNTYSVSIDSERQITVDQDWRCYSQFAKRRNTEKSAF